MKPWLLGQRDILIGAGEAKPIAFVPVSFSSLTRFSRALVASVEDVGFGAGAGLDLPANLQRRQKIMSKFWASSSSSSSSDDDDSSESDGENIAVNKIDSDGENFDAMDDYSAEDHQQLSEDPNAAWEVIKSEQAFLKPPSKETANPENQGTKDYTRIVCISDTHSKHREVVLPPGDILVHGGDFSKSGEIGTVRDLSAYFRESGFNNIVCIAGNHDTTFHPSFYSEHSQNFHPKRFNCEESRAALQSCRYLEDEALVIRDGDAEVNTYGSPWSPEFYVWAFGLPRGGPIQEKWDSIPDDADVLITHGPPLGRGDWTDHNGRAGCYDLLRTVQNRVRPRVHIFGHIHEGRGVTYDGHTLYVNASILDIGYRAINLPIVIDIPHDKTKPAQVVKPVCRLTAEDFIRRAESEGYQELAEKLKGVDPSRLPSGNTLVGPSAYSNIECATAISRKSPMLRDLRVLLGKIHADSY